MLVLTALAGGVVLGLLMGGSLRALGSVRLRGAPLLAPVLLLQVLPLGHLPRPVASGVWVAQAMLSVVFALMNSNPGFITIACGIGSNAFVLLTHGHMPVDEQAVRYLSTVSATLDPTPARVVDAIYALPISDPGTLLADVMPMRALGVVVSVGDVLMLVGVTVVLVSMMNAEEGALPTGVELT